MKPTFRVGDLLVARMVGNKTHDCYIVTKDQWTLLPGALTSARVFFLSSQRGRHAKLYFSADAIDNRVFE